MHHVAVWLDHQEARVFRIAEDSFDESTVRLNAHHLRRHPDRNAPAGRLPPRAFDAVSGEVRTTPRGRAAHRLS
jgi:hypothetical protein